MPKRRQRRNVGVTSHDPPLPVRTAALMEPASNILFGARGPTTSSGTWNREVDSARTYAIHHNYWAWTDNWATSTQMTYWGATAGSGHRRYMVSWNVPTTSTFLADVNAGTHDALISFRAAACAAKSYPLFLRPMYEMNGYFQTNLCCVNSNGTTTGRPTAASYVSAWRRIYDLFQAAGATNVAFVWCPVRNDIPAVAANAYANYYPGVNYVDWVGIDAYNWGSHATQGDGHWWTFDNLLSYGNSFGSGTGIYSAYHNDHPIMLGEWGCIQDAFAIAPHTRAEWYGEVAAAAAAYTDLKALVYFDTDGNASPVEHWKPDSDGSGSSAYTNWKTLSNTSIMSGMPSS